MTVRLGREGYRIERPSGILEPQTYRKDLSPNLKYDLSVNTIELDTYTTVSPIYDHAFLNILDTGDMMLMVV